MARMINNKFGCVSAVENQCLGKLEHDLKHDKRWKERIKHEEAKRQGKGQAVGRPTEVFHG
ncbi:hypothetical protein LSP04_17440 [Levilactobacillus spicheri]|uniref:Transposase n=1 Tax=Levilactobacillus spicheri TaxID=216463 RepID=A0ABQ0WRL6_9LACO|nr:hypothetical protein LSP04_17440 [Levilactobacillus spicheri]